MNRHEQQNNRRNHRKAVPWRWMFTVTCSALIGAGATFALYPKTNQFHASNTFTTSVSGSPVTSLPAETTGSVQNGVVQAVKRVEPAVVGIVNFKRVSDFFTQQSKLQPNDVGSGVLISKNAQFGYFVTNNHVVQGAARVEVVMKKGSHVTASVVGTDPYTDLAVIRVSSGAVKGISPVAFADSENLQVGEPAIAIGSPMGLDFEDSVTSGIVSAKSRVMPVEQPNDPQHNILDYQTVIQTDAAINPGNSGGPLLNINGEIIGINSSKIVDPTVEGMGFAIPSNEVQNIAGQIMRTGHASHPSLGIEGISLTTIPEEWWPEVPVDYGVWVRSVVSKQTEDSGLKPEDVIVGYNGKTVRTMADLRTYLFDSQPGEKVRLKVYRENALRNLQITLGKMDSPNTTGQRTEENNVEDSNLFIFPSAVR